MEFRVQTLADIRERIGKKRLGLPQEASSGWETEGSSGGDAAASFGILLPPLFLLETPHAFVW